MVIFSWFFFINFSLDVFDWGQIKLIPLFGFFLAIVSVNNEQQQVANVSELKSVSLSTCVYGIVITCCSLFAVGRASKLQDYSLAVTNVERKKQVINNIGIPGKKQYAQLKSAFDIYTSEKLETNACDNKLQGSIAVFDLADNISFMVGAPSPKLTHLWIHYGVSISRATQPKFEDFIGNASAIFIPKYPFAPESTRQLTKAYRKSLDQYQKIKYDDWTIINLCKKNTSPLQRK